MIQVINKIIPFGVFKAMAVWPFIFLKSDCSSKTLNHEKIHCRQQIELLLIGFYILYFICWIKELIHCALVPDRGQSVYNNRSYFHRVEHSIIFEREAYHKDKDLDYLSRRRFWNWMIF